MQHSARKRWASIFQEFHRKILPPIAGDIKHENFALLAAYYCIKAGDEFPASSACELPSSRFELGLRTLHLKLEKPVDDPKEIFLKNGRKSDFVNQIGLKLPPVPIIMTCLNSWLVMECASIWSNEQCDIVKESILEFDESTSFIET